MKLKQVDDYIAKEEAWKRQILAELRDVVHEADPGFPRHLSGVPLFLKITEV